MNRLRNLLLATTEGKRLTSFFTRCVCLLASAAFIIALQIPLAALGSAVYPPSDVITGISFDMSTLINTVPGNGVRAPESDNWTITWADDGHQYTSFGDGYGFATSNTTRASFGVSRIEGGKDNYSAFDVWKTGDVSGGFGGKSYGIISIDGTLYMLRCGVASTDGIFSQVDIYKSTNHGVTWTSMGVQWLESEFTQSDSFFCPTYLQYGQDYAGARDDFVYIYAPEYTQPRQPASDDWEVQSPGRFTLIRVNKNAMENRGAYEYFAGFSNDQPQWTSNLNAREPVFEDNVNGVMRLSVSYNPGLDRYILITQQVSRFRAEDFHIGIYDAPEPWGPWSTVLFANPDNEIPGRLNSGWKSVYWNFSNKWLSADGKDFVLVYTGDSHDEWGTVEGSFTVNNNPVLPSVTLNASPTTVAENSPTVLTWSSTNADDCTATGGWTGQRPANNASGVSSDPLSADTTFTLTCTNDNGSDDMSVTVAVDRVAPSPPSNLTTDPDS